MTETTRPKRIFMASNLSARCDRALARAALLARAWNSKLTVAHVMHAAEVAARDLISSGAPSWLRPDSWSQTLERALRADLAAEGISATSRDLIGTTTDAVLQGAADDNADLVMLGSQGRSGLARALLGSTAVNLFRTLDCDTLVVRGA